MKKSPIQSYIEKVNTTLQVALLAAALAAPEQALDWPLFQYSSSSSSSFLDAGWGLQVLSLGVSLTTIWSGGQYLNLFLNHRDELLLEQQHDDNDDDANNESK